MRIKHKYNAQNFMQGYRKVRQSEEAQAIMEEYPGVFLEFEHVMWRPRKDIVSEFIDKAGIDGTGITDLGPTQLDRKTLTQRFVRFLNKNYSQTYLNHKRVSTLNKLLEKQ